MTNQLRYSKYYIAHLLQAVQFNSPWELLSAAIRTPPAPPPSTTVILTQYKYNVRLKIYIDFTRMKAKTKIEEVISWKNDYESSMFKKMVIC